MMRRNSNGKSGGYQKHRGGSGRRHHHHNNNGGSNRNDSGNNIMRRKHHAMQQREKYSKMAHDALSHGDRADVEYYLQHVDHYTRVLTEIAVAEAERYNAYREQQAANGEFATPAGDTAAPVSEEGDANSGNAEPIDFTGGHQPRMTRSPRYGQVAPVAEAPAAPAASNGGDIPLPGGILPAL